MRVPTDATPDVQQAFRDVWAAIDKLTSGNLDLKGRRVINAGQSEGVFDLVTKDELNQALQRIATLEAK